jgi:hypothetical protein
VCKKSALLTRVGSFEVQRTLSNSNFIEQFANFIRQTVERPNPAADLSCNWHTITMVQEEESHQDALAALVAAENKKLLKKELAPPPVPLMDVDSLREQDELAQLQVCVSVWVWVSLYALVCACLSCQCLN